MRVLRQVTAVVCVVAATAVQGQQKPEASAILAQAREALGGEKKLTEVKNFVVTGRTRKVQGNNLVPVEFEIAVEFPDKYVRKDEIPAQESGPTSTGFNGEDMIQLPVPVAPPPRAGGPGAPGGAPPAGARPGGPPAGAPPATGTPPAGTPPPATGTPTTPPAAGTPPAGATPPGGATPPAAGTPPGALPGAGRAMGPGAPGMPPGGGRPGGPPVDPRKARLYTVKQDFTKLTLGMFAASFSTYPLTFTYAGQAEAPQGKADVLDVKGEGNFALRLFISTQTHQPIMVSWTTPATNVVMALPGQPPPKDIPPGSVVVEAPPLPPPTAPKEEQDKYAKDVQALRAKSLATAKPVENRIFYSDYRDAGNGLMFPFRHRRSIAGETVEETTFDQFRINTRIDPRKFEVRK
jgi:hypothetical protein